MKINILDSRIYNRIAAGEVVERPSSIVKELIENSIDAGASKITVEVENYGVKKIKVTDNGCGIEFEDVKTAFLPHATSKISNVDDLDKISTMGFRGEALASIASVSMIEMRTRTESSDVGTSIILRGGEIEDCSSCACAVGTSITVENLFFNTPARLKFLRQKRTEEIDIYNTVLKLATANAFVSIKYVLDGKTLISTDGFGLDDFIKKVYPIDIVSNLLPLSEIFDSYEINGYVGKRGFSKTNKTYQTLIVNGRVVTNNTINQAVISAYGDGLTKGSYPVFVFDIVMPFEDVDVNVHPNKKDVRFRDNNRIFSFVYRAVTNCFRNNSANSVINYSDYSNTLTNIGLNNISTENKNNFNSGFLNKNSSDNKSNLLFEDDSENFENRLIDRRRKSPYELLHHKSNPVVSFQDIGDSTLAELLNREIEIKKQIAKKEYQQASFELSEKPKVIGQIFGTYLIVEKEASIFIFDQHACQEKIIYDKLKEQYKNKMIIQQELLVPYILNLTYYDNIAFSEFFKTMNKLGFEIEYLGEMTYKISKIPVVLSDINIEELIKELNINSMNLSEISTEAILKDKLAMIACKSSIKGKTALNSEQIEMLFNEFTKKDSQYPLFCPHGRPAVIKIDKSYIEKLFKRDY